MKYDIIICGSGVAGLWLLNTLTQKGFNVLLIEKNTLGGVQTLASQGMIHGGQKYLLTGRATPEARAIAKMPKRWEACLNGTGEIDLRGVVVLSERQVMWAAGSKLSELGLIAAANLVHAETRKLSPEEYPEALKANSGAVYELPEKVLDTHSLVSVLARTHEKKIVKGTITKLSPDGSLTVDGQNLEAQLVIFTAGLGNEDALQMLGERIEERSQRRPLRQIMVKTMDSVLYGHGVVNNPKPRVTVTSHPLQGSGYVWSLGGSIAESTVSMTEEEAIAYAQREMSEMFPHIEWPKKQWTTWLGDRAEARHLDGFIQDGPVVQEYGNVLVAWPTKLTFAPELSDTVLKLVGTRQIVPRHTDTPPVFPMPESGSSPWEDDLWAK